jgi:hypothetical protein
MVGWSTLWRTFFGKDQIPSTLAVRGQADKAASLTLHRPRLVAASLLESKAMVAVVYERLECDERVDVIAQE